MNLLGFYSHKESSAAIVVDNVLLAHIELERYHRIKEAPGPSVEYAVKYALPALGLELKDIDCFATVYRSSYYGVYGDQQYVPREKLRYFGHHEAHCADAFFSSDFSDALIISLDGGGWESDKLYAGATVYYGRDGNIFPVRIFASTEHLPGSAWGRATRYVFRESVGPPLGHKAGTLMAMAAFGDGKQFHQKFYDALTCKLEEATWCPPGHLAFKEQIENSSIVEALDLTKNEPHPYWDEFTKLADESDAARFDLAAGLQSATEQYIREFIANAVRLAADQGFKSNNICITGGTALNSVAMGKVKEWFPNLNLYIPPIPYDAGLCIGVCYLSSLALSPERKAPIFKKPTTPFFGIPYSAAREKHALLHYQDKVQVKRSSLEEVASSLYQDKIVAVFHGESESGRRALGHRSILANPCSPNMKQMINDKVKHRQWFRPFAPAILHEYGPQWFENYQFSPTMSLCLAFKEEKRASVPAVVHKDGTGRLQSVTEENDFLYELLQKFNKLSGVPVLLNTSFNDREPIVETPEHAIACFLKTDIDYLYFSEAKLLVEKRR